MRSCPPRDSCPSVSRAVRMVDFTQVLSDVGHARRCRVHLDVGPGGLRPVRHLLEREGARARGREHDLGRPRGRRGGLHARMPRLEGRRGSTTWTVPRGFSERDGVAATPRPRRDGLAAARRGPRRVAPRDLRRFYPSWPASSPWVTAVGATRFVGQKVGGEEMASDQFGSGGGFSAEWDRSNATWQEDAVQAYRGGVKIRVPARRRRPSRLTFATLDRGRRRRS